MKFVQSPILVLVCCLTLVASARAAGSFTTVTFPSEDGLLITADLYEVDDRADRPFIVLFHQANCGKSALAAGL